MSIFIDKLNRLSEGGHQPIGFGIKKIASPGPKMQLVAALSQENAVESIDNLTGADAVLLRISKAGTAESIKKVSEAFPDVPCGVLLQDSGKTEMKQIAEADCDFIVFTAAGTPLTATGNDKAGKIIQVEPDIDEGLLRTANTLPVDAVFIAGGEKKEEAITWQQLMLFQRFADLLTKPLLVTVPAKVTISELLSLWEAGVSGVVVEAGADRLKKLRQEIDKTDFPSRRRAGKTDAVLPRSSGGTITPVDDDEDDELGCLTRNQNGVYTFFNRIRKKL